MSISLVTGGAGFVGSHVVEHLLKMGHRVVIVDNLSGGSLDNVKGFVTTVHDADFNSIGVSPDDVHGATLVVGDIRDSDHVNRLFDLYQPDFVFHLAAYAAESLSHHIRRFTYETNLIGSVNLINAAVNAGTVRRFVFTSSAAVYDPVGYIAASELLRPEPTDPYGVSKLAVELDLACAKAMFGLSYTIFRCHNIYGERQSLSDGYRNVIGIFMRQCLSGQPMTIYGDGTQSRQFTYIGDVAPALAGCIEVPLTENQTFNIGCPQSATVNGVAAWVALALSPHAETIHLPERHEVKHAHLDHDRFERVFGPREWVMPWDGIAKMAAWAKTQPLCEPRAFDGIEIEKGLPEHWRQLSNS